METAHTGPCISTQPCVSVCCVPGFAPSVDGCDVRCSSCDIRCTGCDIGLIAFIVSMNRFIICGGDYIGFVACRLSFGVSFCGCILSVSGCVSRFTLFCTPKVSSIGLV